MSYERDRCRFLTLDRAEQPHLQDNGIHATSNEKLFLRSLFEALAEHAQAPPAGLPKSIAKVVDNVHVRHPDARAHNRFA